MPFSTQEADQGKGAKALDEPGGGDRMSASQKWTIWTCPNCGIRRTEMTDEPCGGCAQVTGVRIRSVVPAEQLQVAVEALAKAKRALEVIADDKLSSLRLRDSNCVRYFADDALKALGESQEEM